MKTGIVGLAGLLLAGMAWVQPAAAQNVPPGSYLQSCFRAFVEGDRLVAVCRRADGREQRTSLPDVLRCVGDIGNNNGNLQCNYAGGPPGPPPGYYGERRYGEDRRERCFGLRREAEELRERMEREFNPMERMRIEGRLHEVREQEERMDCRR
jgi:hypothetical protein